MIRKSTYTVEEILPLIPNTKHSKSNNINEFVNLDGDEVRIDSSRLRLFKLSGISCVKCGITASFFAKEKHDDVNYHQHSLHNPERYHLNLYAVNKHGNEVLMTKDHIKPQSHGGRDNQSNLQTMCAPCNQKKANNYANYKEKELA